MDEKEQTSSTIGLDLIRGLYEEHRDALGAVREQQRALLRSLPTMKAQLDDIEAEITYLLLRHFRPAKVVEIGSLHGWSTTWLLHALTDNGAGRLVTLDLVDTAAWTVPRSLAADLWEFRQGDARTLAVDWTDELDYLFIDADHGSRFARWYLGSIFPRLRPATPVSVHDVFHRARPFPLTEGHEVLRWLATTGTSYFTVARALSADAELVSIRRELGLFEPVHTGRANPMIFFRLP